MPESVGDVQSVLTELRHFRDRAGEIIDRIAGRSSITPDEKRELQALLKTLKTELQTAGKTGTVAGVQRPKTQTETAYFARAVQKAHAHLGMATNSDPISSNWGPYLAEARGDIARMISQLEEEYPDY